MKLNFTKIRYVITIIQQREKFASDLVIKGFTFIEMLISLFITILI
ncbi:prepilin-type N-terminal cleavage/methylation domain-containing protein, partial [Staphylococcus haemolyticus]